MPRHVLCQVILKFAGSNLMVIVAVRLSLQPLHQEVTEEALLDLIQATGDLAATGRREDSEVLRILRECFFVFDMTGNWASELVDFLNKPREKIEGLWQYKLKKQQIYDKQLFLNTDTKPGHISAKVIRAIAKVGGVREQPLEL